MFTDTVMPFHFCLCIFVIQFKLCYLLTAIIIVLISVEETVKCFQL